MLLILGAWSDAVLFITNTLLTVPFVVVTEQVILAVELVPIPVKTIVLTPSLSDVVSTDPLSVVTLEEVIVSPWLSTVTTNVPPSLLGVLVVSEIVGTTPLAKII